ncbi:LEUCINE-RICH REPEAT RECEPTOR-LIKE PROTEIN KINASE PXC1 [Salix purpurea]|uniref:LEUCINE-RICH REPEAT RECEPTOR-LIKE PROTEIN KINASE PXC1 n=1 Tax=Salix purpurea TaxID=77065 RepID=A0A9Q0ULJ4_SALPP|nr:LEUCINE-RICH REPEAT RECEPTOR-LIKE PROTEIN KINASE PXC1 [Salix purpurea]
MAHKVLLFYFLVTACHLFAASHGATDAEILVNFKNSLSTNSLLYDWNVSGIPPCTGGSDNWVGLRCNDDGTIDKLLLENMGLNGTIDMDILMQLPKLRTLSFMNNSFEGPMPEVKKLASLRNLYLSNDSFSGKIDKDAFDGMNSVTISRVEIPTDLCRLRSELFCGLIPLAILWFSISIQSTFVLVLINIYWMQLETHLRVLPSWSNNFDGFVGAVVVLSAIVVFARIRFGDGKKEAQSSIRLVMAVLLDGPAMVVKRFRHMSSGGKEEFHEHMRKLGALSHPNLLPLVAYYYRKEDKLLISDFIENGSLASRLHGKRSPGKPWIDWPTRLRIIKGVAKGLAYLYKEFPTLALPHGHLKSSNVLLDDTFDPLLTDYALVPVVNKDHSQRFMVAYKSPECSRSDRPNRKTDVWSLGILILEILTGKFPENYLTVGKGGDADLATWVNSAVREEWTGEVGFEGGCSQN